VIVDNDGILEPALKIGPAWPATRLEAWANKEISTFGAMAKLFPYPSQGGRNLERIVFALPSQPGPQIAEMYFGDDGEWWVQHYKTPVGRELAYHVYNQLLGQGIALTLPEWVEKNLNLKPKETPEKKKKRGRPRKQPATRLP
jgi:hypothetical protein